MGYDDRSSWKLVVGILLLIPFILWGGMRIYKGIVLKIECTGHIKRAADANTINLAIQEMKTVVSFLEREKITSGYTSVIYITPSEDVGFWYQNLKASLEELEKVKPEATQLEKSNILIKLRETLLDHGQSVSITAPSGINVFPNNAGYAIFGVLCFILLIVGVVLIFYE